MGPRSMKLPEPILVPQNSCLEHLLCDSKYSALEIRQTPDSDPFYAMVVKADELLEWADVPRKKAEFMAGYQRELLDRYSRITDFINQDPKHNVIPGAVIVATSPGTVTFARANEAGTVRLTINQEERDLKVRVGEVADSFYDRLSEEEKAASPRETAFQN